MDHVPPATDGGSRWGSVDLVWATEPRVALMVSAATAAVVGVIGVAGSTRPLWAVLIGMAVAASIIAVVPTRPRSALAAAVLATAVDPLLGPIDGATGVMLVIVMAAVAALSAVPWPLLFVLGFGSLCVGSALAAARAPGTFTAGDVVVEMVENLVFAGLATGLGVFVAITRRQGQQLVELERARQDRILDEERHRIARELHDLTAHHLAAVAVRTRTAHKLGDGDDLRDAVEYAGRAVDESLQSMSRIVSMLRRSDGQEPPQPRLADLDSAAEQLSDAGLVVDLTVDPDLGRRLDRSTELTIVRICQEALSNAVRHAAPTTATVDIVADVGEVVARIDDGGGKRAAVGPKDAVAGHGLIGMRERARAAGGTLTVDRSPLGGWRVEARIPIPTDHSRS